jgi:uncharacterized protein YjgD (DUF1641 family)
VAVMEPSLTDAQWEGLRRLGELAIALDRVLEGPMGSALAEYVVQGSAMVPDGALDAVQHALSILVKWHESGFLDRMSGAMDLLQSTLSNEAVSSVLIELIGVVRTIQEDLGTAARDQKYVVGQFGGLKTLVRMMKDPDVQAGLWTMARIAGKLGSAVRKQSSPN